MAVCRYCNKKFQQLYASESVCSKLCGSLALEIMDEELQRQSFRNSRLSRTVEELQRELGKTAHAVEEPTAFTLEFIRAVVDGS